MTNERFTTADSIGTESEERHNSDSGEPTGDGAPPRSISSRRCTNCREPMQKLGLAAHYHRTVEIEVCEECSLIWFDDTESVRLAGPGLLDLIRIIDTATRKPGPLQPLPSLLPCPVCAVPLKKVFNVSRYGRTSQLECVVKHGAFQSFTLFLAEKGYFRRFTWADIKKLLESGKSLTCSHCGARLESHPQDECPFCQSPVGMIDPAKLASAIDNENVAQPLSLAPHVKQAVCPCCGGAVDLSVDTVCPHCMAVVRPEEMQGALSASEAVAEHVRSNYAHQSSEVSRRKLDAAAHSAPDLNPPRTDSMRRGAGIVVTILALGIVVFNMAGRKAPITHYEYDANGNKVGYTAADYNARESARRGVQMASTDHAPTGVAPPGLEAIRRGDSLTLISHTPQRLTVTVNLAYEQYRDMWLRCRMVNVAQDNLHDTTRFTQAGESQTLAPARDCKDKILKKGKYEYTVTEFSSYKPVFKSDSAFFD